MKRSDFDSERFQSAEQPKADKDFTPCSVAEGDELYPNGIFVFNITKMLEYIRDNKDKIELAEVAVADFPRAFSSVDELHVDSVDVSQPVLLAEISPGHYNLIDGNHRMEKARRMGISRILGYKLNVKQHVAFLTERKAYLSYIEYWNEKLK
ncbi:MAG: hypothetical protein J7M20_04920 [Deltaproteobacteria bacterium]|nr:hypothetical protein [Deltaproteobacteria bacterium]